MAINTGVNASKLVGYAATQLPEQVSVTKVVGFAALVAPVLKVSKLVGYAAVSLPAEVAVAKLVGYAALKDGDAPRTTTPNFVWLG